MCVDHPEVQAMVGRIKDRRIVTYGFSPQADVRAVNVSFSEGTSHFDVVFRDRQRKTENKLSGLCLPMPGSHQAQQQDEQATIEFRQARQRHPGIESAIHALQAGNGLVRCRDRSEPGFSRYVQIAVLGRNLHVLGKILIACEDATSKAAKSRRKTAAA